jgi:hypothetical protein
MKKVIYAILLMSSINLLQAQVLKGFISFEKQDNPSVFIHDLILAEDQTIIVLNYIEQEFDKNYLSVHHPNTNYHFSIQTAEKDLALIKAEGIPYAPKQLRVKKGEVHRIKLYFPALPKNVTVFDLVEQNVPKDKSMNIYGIRMSRSDQRNASIRFYEKEDFAQYFEQNQGPFQKFEGFWTVEGNLNSKNQEKSIQDTIAVVYEDGYLKAYDLKGFEYGIKILAEKDHLKIIHKIDQKVFSANKVKIGTTLKYEDELKDLQLFKPTNSLSLYCMLRKH